MVVLHTSYSHCSDVKPEGCSTRACVVAITRETGSSFMCIIFTCLWGDYFREEHGMVVLVLHGGWLKVLGLMMVLTCRLTQ